MSDEVAFPAFSQLSHSVYASPEYANCSECKTHQEAFEFQRVAKLDKEWVLVESCFAQGLVAAARSEGKVDAENHEDEEGEDLKGETSDHYIIS
jgi:hypothetical protein